MTDPDTILLETEAALEKALDYLKAEMKGVRTGRASTAMVEFIKVDAYGSATDLKNLAAIGTPEATQILIKPFDASLVSAIKTAIEKSGLGVNPMVEGKQLRINLPPMSQDRRVKEAARVKKMAEEAKVVMRNARRDGNKHADGLKNLPGGKHYPEDEIKTLKEEIQSLLEKYESDADKRVEEKTKEIMTI
ncbi:MAG TPA: ribosome recycling factor [Phycisphaerales bacterium]|nr:ribosome recycling factor [Phycisphaerales bacterium]